MSDIGKVILLTKNGKDGQFLPIPRNSKQEIVIGKKATADIRIKNVDVADEHCSISYNGYKAIIRPLSKSATTFVNNSAIKGQQTVVLKHNDLIQIEDRTFRWEYVQDDDEPRSNSPVKGQRKSEPAIKMVGTGVTSNRSMMLASPVFKRRSLMFKKSAPALPVSKTNKANAALRKINKTPGLNRSHLNSAAKLKNPNILRVLKQGFLASPSQDIGGEVNVVSGVLSSPVKTPGQSSSSIQQGRVSSPVKSPVGKAGSPQAQSSSGSTSVKSPVGKVCSPVKSPQAQQSSRSVVLNGKSATSPRRTAAKSGSPQGTKSARPATSGKKKPMSPKMSRAKRKLDLNESNGYADDDSLMEGEEDVTDGTGTNHAEFFSLSEEDVEIISGGGEPSSSLYEDSVCSLPSTPASLFHSTAVDGSSVLRNKTPSTSSQQHQSRTLNRTTSPSLSQTTTPVYNNSSPFSSRSSNRTPCYHPSRNLSKPTTPSSVSRSTVSRSNVASLSRSRTLNNSTAVNRTALTNASRGSTSKNVSLSVSHNKTVTNASVVSPRHSLTTRRVYSNNNSRSRRSSRSPEFESTLNFWENLEDESTSSVTSGGKSASNKSRNNSPRGLSVANGVLNGTSSRVSTGKNSLLSPLYVSPGTSGVAASSTTPSSSFYSPQSNSLPPATDKQHSAIFTPYTCDLSPNSRIGTPLTGSGITSPIQAYDSVTAEEIQAALSAAAHAAQQDTPPTTPDHTPSPRGSSRKSTPSGASKKTPTPATRTPRGAASQNSTPSSTAAKSPRNSTRSATPQSAAKSSPASSFGGSSKKSTPVVRGSSTASSAKSSPRTPAKKAGATPKRPTLVVTPGKKLATPKSGTKKSPATTSSSRKSSTTPKSGSKKTPTSSKKTPSTAKSTPRSTPKKIPSTAKSTPKKTPSTAKSTPKKTPSTAKSTPRKSPKGTPAASPAAVSSRKSTPASSASKRTTPTSKRATPSSKRGTPTSKQTTPSSSKASTPKSPAAQKTPPAKKSSTPAKSAKKSSPTPRKKATLQIALKKVATPVRKTPAKKASKTPQKKTPAKKSVPASSAQKKTPTPRGAALKKVSISEQEEPAPLFAGARAAASPLVVYNLVTPDELEVAETISLPLCSAVKTTPPPSRNSSRQSSSASGSGSASISKASSSTFNASRLASSPLVVYNLLTEDEIDKAESISLPLCSLHGSPSPGVLSPSPGPSSGKKSPKTTRSSGKKSPKNQTCSPACFNAARKSSSPLVVYNLVTEEELVGEVLPPVGFSPSNRRSPGGFPPAQPTPTVLNASRSSSSPLVVYNLVTPGQLSHVAEPLEEALDSAPVPSETDSTPPPAQKSANSRRKGFPPAQPTSTVLNASRSSSSPLSY
uniref:FHA domain-containing protein n=1 Tax=Cacopsylla melanoneura TaxID=428564 RepID=A0A8D8TVC0_9HEMI